MSLDGHHETNRLLRQALIEQQLQSCAAEFEGRTFVRSMSGGPPRRPSTSCSRSTSRPARRRDRRGWARRHLEGMRPLVLDEENRRRIDLACDRPDQVNPRLVGRYIEALDGKEPAALEAFVAEAVGEREARACTAAFLLAGEAPEGASSGGSARSSPA